MCKENGAWPSVDGTHAIDGKEMPWVIPQRTLNVLPGFGNVSAGYEEHGRNFVSACRWVGGC